MKIVEKQRQEKGREESVREKGGGEKNIDSQFFLAQDIIFTFTQYYIVGISTTINLFNQQAQILNQSIK